MSNATLPVPTSAELLGMIANAEAKFEASRPKAQRLLVKKGSPTAGVTAREFWTVKAIRPLGAEYSHRADLVLERAGRTLTFQVRNANRVDDPEFNASRHGATVRFSR